MIFAGFVPKIGGALVGWLEGGVAPVLIRVGGVDQDEARDLLGSHSDGR
jgi:hypothetical protein